MLIRIALLGLVWFSFPFALGLLVNGGEAFLRSALAWLL